jgi:N-acetylglucosaminyl-diphospho-decaprenol L-rhamnosyltransferase
MDLSIIIINWNSVKYVRECLLSIYLHTKDAEFEVIVVDNASYDGCGEMLAGEFPSVKFIQSEENLGFARGNNLAAMHSSGDVLLFLNPDTEIHGPALTSLYESIRSLPKAGAVGARLLNGNGTVQTSCLQTFPTISNQLLDADLLRRLFPRASVWGMTPLFTDADTPRSIDGISGACLMTRRDIFRKVGGFSEDYFMYYEDMDYCLKVRNEGWNNYFVPSAVVTHYGGKSSGSENYSRFSAEMMAESAWRFFRKQRGPRYAHLFRIALAVKALSRVYLLLSARMVTFSETRCGRIKRGAQQMDLRASVVPGS